MITIPTLLVLGVAGGITAVSAGMSVFGKNQKTNKIWSAVGIASFTALALLLTIPSVSFSLAKTTINFSPVSKWFNRKLTFGIGVTNLKDIILNSLMLAPLGVLTSHHLIAKNKLKNAKENKNEDKKTKLKNNLKIVLKSFLAGLSLGFFIEISQSILPFGRYPTLSDALLNGMSAGIGSSCLFACHGIKNAIVKRKQQKQLQKQELNQKAKSMELENNLTNINVETNEKVNNSINENANYETLKSELKKVETQTLKKSKKSHKNSEETNLIGEENEAKI